MAAHRPDARPEKAGGIGCYRSHLAALADGGGVRRHHAYHRGRRDRFAGGCWRLPRRPRGDGAGTIRPRYSFAWDRPSVRHDASVSPPPTARPPARPRPSRSTASSQLDQFLPRQPAGARQGARASRGRAAIPRRSTISSDALVASGRSTPGRPAVPLVRGPGDRRAVVDPGRGPGPVFPAADFAAPFLCRPRRRRGPARQRRNPAGALAGAGLLSRRFGSGFRRPRTSPDGRTSRAP